MSEYDRHLAMIADMDGWRAPATAPRYVPVTIMDHAGNTVEAVWDGAKWTTHAPYSSMLHGQPIRPRKWRAEPA